MNTGVALPLFARALEPMLRYHDYRVEGIEHIPVVGRAMIVLHHSLATYDCLLLAASIWHKTGRAPVGLGHDRLFDVPGLSTLVKKLGLRRASPENGQDLLEQGELLCVAPGGMREALRPSAERYKVCWEGRRGFVRLALKTQTPMILAACPKADDLFEVQEHAMTEWVYDNFRWPLPVFKGRRGLPVPKRVPLVHHIATPIVPPVLDEDNLDMQIDELHGVASQTMEQLLSMH